MMPPFDTALLKHCSPRAGETHIESRAARRGRHAARWRRVLTAVAGLLRQGQVPLMRQRRG